MSYVNQNLCRIYELYLYFMSYINLGTIKIMNLKLKTPDFILQGKNLILVYNYVILKLLIKTAHNRSPYMKMTHSKKKLK